MLSPTAVLLALLSGPPTAVPADGPVWVFFADRPVADPGLALGAPVLLALARRRRRRA